MGLPPGRKLSDLVADRMAEKRAEAGLEKYSVRIPDQFSPIGFTDLTPLTQEEIDLFWPYEGSELERKIALRLATRTAEETYRAIHAKWSGSNAPCHKCGERKRDCKCLISCPRCWVRHYRDTPHTCDEEKVEEIASNPWGSIFGAIRQV